MTKNKKYFNKNDIQYDIVDSFLNYKNVRNQIKKFGCHQIYNENITQFTNDFYEKICENIMQQIEQKLYKKYGVYSFHPKWLDNTQNYILKNNIIQKCYSIYLKYNKQYIIFKKLERLHNDFVR